MATLYLTPFGKNDSRLEHALTEVEPRIHFALNCGAKSCPPIKTFTASDVDNELKLATGILVKVLLRLSFFRAHLTS